MNKAVLMGRLTRDPEVRYLTGDKPMAVARYTLAVDRRTKETQISSSARHLTKRRNLRRNIFPRESRLWLRGGSRPAAT